jgi:hypothetical protein
MRNLNDLDMYINNIRQLFELKDNEFRMLERKCNMLEEENQTLKNKIMDYEQSFKNQATNNSLTTSGIRNNSNYNKVNNKIAEANILISSFNREKSIKNRSYISSKNEKENDLLQSPSDINQIIRENQYLYSPTNYSISSKNIDSDTNRTEIKDFLLIVKSRVPSDSFKDFIKYLKLLTQKNNTIDRTEILIEVRKIFYNSHDLYDKFERIILNK